MLESFYHISLEGTFLEEDENSRELLNIIQHISGKSGISLTSVSLQSAFPLPNSQMKEMS